MAKRGTYDHRKTKRLARRLGISQSHAYGILCRLWDVCEEQVPAGDIGHYSDDEIADEVDWTGDPGALTDALVETGWLDRHETYRLIIHDWPDHCENIVHNKLARQHAFFADGTAPKTGRLEPAYKQKAEEFYAQNRAVSARKPPQSAQKEDESAQISADHQLISA
jgi:hypothetical protein